MEKMTLKDIGIYAVMGVLVLMLSSGIVSLISMVSSRLLPTAVQLRFANIVLILAYAIIYPLLWSRRECTAMLRGEDVPDVSAFVRRFMRTRVVPQALVQFAVCLLGCPDKADFTGLKP